MVALQTLQLPRYVHACRTPEGVVFLDTRHDRYFGFSGKWIDVLSAVVLGWPGNYPTDADESAGRRPEIEKITNTLVERGLLVKCGLESTPHARIEIPALTMPPPRRTAERIRSPQAVDVTNFVMACAKAAWALKFRSLEQIELEISRARADAREREAPSAEQATALAHVFRRLRRFFISERDRCLFNALSLVYFLRRYGHYPFWVIGVNTSPFMAHSWVQDGHLALDGDPAVLCHFTPILAA